MSASVSVGSCAVERDGLITHMHRYRFIGVRRTCLAQTRFRHSIDLIPAEGNLEWEENNKEDNLKAAAYGLI